MFSKLAIGKKKIQIEYFLDLIKSFKWEVTITERYYYAWVVKIGAEIIIICRKGFETAYSISSWLVEDVINRFKAGDIKAEMLLSDRQRSYYESHLSAENP